MCSPTSGARRGSRPVIRSGGFELANQALERLKPAICRPYALEGRPSVPREQLHFNLLFFWFVGLSPDDPIWHPTNFGLRPNSATPKTVIDSPMTTSSGCSLRR